MLRITIDTSPELVTLKLEGKLKGIWVEELERVWQSIRCHGERKAVCADLSAVSYVDDHGKTVLALMNCAGVELRAEDPMIKAILEEATQPGCGDNG